MLNTTIKTEKKKDKFLKKNCKDCSSEGRLDKIGANISKPL